MDRAEHCDNVRPFRSKLLHLCDGQFQDAGDGSLPAGMRGGDDARLRIGEEHRTAIRRPDAHGNARLRAHHRVGLRAEAGSPYLLDHHSVGPVHLIGRREILRACPEMARGAGAVLQNKPALVLRPDAGIQPSIDAGRDAALAREEAMRDSRKGKRRRFYRPEALGISVHEVDLGCRND